MTNANLGTLLLIGIIILTPFIVFLNGSNVQAESIGDDWPMFLHDPSHSGVTISTGPTEAVELWRFAEGHFDGSFIGSSAAVVNGIVYAGSNYNAVDKSGYSVYALDAYTGAKIWNYSTNGGVYSSPAVYGNRVFIGVGPNVCAFDAYTGAQLWSYQTGSFEVDSSPSVVNGVVYVGALDKNVYALDASTGSKIWSYKTQGSVYSSPAVVNGVVYVGSDDCNVYALNASSGMKIWNHTVSKYGRINSSPAVSEGRVYVGSIDRNVYALNASTGEQIWKYTTGPALDVAANYDGGVQASPAVYNNAVYIASEDGNIYALNASTGTTIWEYPTYFDVLLSSPAIANGVLYVGSGQAVLAINVTSGSYLWSFNTDNTINASPVVYNGVVYIPSQDGNLYAIGKPSNVIYLSPGGPVISVQTLWLIISISVIITVLVIAIKVHYKRRKP